MILSIILSLSLSSVPLTLLVCSRDRAGLSLKGYGCCGSGDIFKFSSQICCGSSIALNYGWQCLALPGPSATSSDIFLNVEGARRQQEKTDRFSSKSVRESSESPHNSDPLTTNVTGFIPHARYTCSSANGTQGCLNVSLRLWEWS